MRALKELALIVHNNRARGTTFVIDDDQTTDSPLHAFYYGLVRNELSTDDDAAEKVLNTDRRSSRYQKLKGKLKQNLLNTLFFIDTQKVSYTNRQKAYYEAYKDWAAAKILLGKNARVIGAQLCHRVLNLSLKYEFTDLAVDVLRVLRLHYGARVGDEKKYDEYNTLFKEYEAIYHEENKAEEYYTELILKFVNSKASDEATHEKAFFYYNQLKPVLQKYNSYRLQLCGMLIRLMASTSINDYRRTAEICEDYLTLFRQKKYDANVPLQIAYYQQLVCYTQLKEYKAGKKAAQKCKDYMDKGSFNWFKYQELYFTLCMHTENYQEAYDIYMDTVNHKRYQFMPPIVMETWQIYDAYLHFLVDLNKVEPYPNDDSFNKFRLGRFLNNTPIFSKDKRGMNIPILAIQTIFLIHQQKYGKAIDRIEAVERYCSRYLRKGDTFRSNCFIKMLLEIPKANFHREAVIRKTEDLLNRLNDVPLDVSNQAYEIEIIPYETLWELLLNSLGNSFHHARR